MNVTLSDKPIIRGRQEERRTDAINAILNAAQMIICERGLAGASLTNISKRSGYSRGLLIHYFGSGERLLEHLLEQIFKRGRSNFRRRIGLKESDSGLERIVKVADGYVQGYAKVREREPSLLVLWGANLPSDLHLDSVLDSDETFREWIRQEIDAGQADGSISEEIDAESYAPILLGMMKGISAQLLMDRKKIKPRKLRATLKMTLIRALTV